MVEIPLQPVPSQEFDITLDEQQCTIKLYQRGDYMYMDLYKDNQPIGLGLICLSDEVIAIKKTINFNGYLIFADGKVQGSPPYWEELDDRYVLCYFSENDTDLVDTTDITEDITIIEETPTVVICDCTGTAGTVIPAGVVIRTITDKQLISLNNVTIPASGTIQLEFQCVDYGPVEILPHTCTRIVTKIQGWNTVDNKSAGIIGTNEEKI